MRSRIASGVAAAALVLVSGAIPARGEVRSDHPRVYLNKDTLPGIKERCAGPNKAMYEKLKKAVDALIADPSKDQIYCLNAADGKILAAVAPDLYMIDASPKGYSLLGKAKLGLCRWASPSFAGGRLYLRTNRNLVCYDLAKR